MRLSCHETRKTPKEIRLGEDPFGLSPSPLSTRCALPHRHAAVASDARLVAVLTLRRKRVIITPRSRSVSRFRRGLLVLTHGKCARGIFSPHLFARKSARGFKRLNGDLLQHPFFRERTKEGVAPTPTRAMTSLSAFTHNV